MQEFHLNLSEASNGTQPEIGFLANDPSDAYGLNTLSSDMPSGLSCSDTLLCSFWVDPAGNPPTWQSDSDSLQLEPLSHNPSSLGDPLTGLNSSQTWVGNNTIDQQVTSQGATTDKSIVIIDPSVPDYETLLQGGNPESVHVLDLHTDGIQQITNILAQYSDLSAVHLVTHGSAGSFRAGSTQLSAGNIDVYSDTLTSWSNAFAVGADFLIYGCNVAEGEVGQSFIRHLSDLIDADIAASDDLTGATALGGDWNLEVHTGQIENSLAFTTAALDRYEQVLQYSQNVFNLLNLLQNSDVIAYGITDAIAKMEDILTSKLETINLPLLEDIGEQLSASTSFLRDFQNKLNNFSSSAIVGEINQYVTFLQDGLFTILGNGSNGLNLLRDTNSDGTINRHDIQVGWFDSSGKQLNLSTEFDITDPLNNNIDALQFNMNLGGEIKTSLPLDFNLPGFNFSVDGGFSAAFQWNFDFGFGFSLTDNFYLATNRQSEVPEIDITLGAFLEGSGGTPFKGEGDFLFFDAEILDNKPGGRSSGLSGGLSLDLIGDASGRLNLSEFNDSSYKADLKALELDIDLQTTLSVPFEGLPRLRGDLELGWVLGQATVPNISFNNFSVDLGSYVGNFLQPVAEKLKEVLSPIAPVIKAFTDEIKSLEKSGIIKSGYSPNLLGLIDLIFDLKNYEKIDWSFLYEAKNIIELAGVISQWNKDESWLSIGDISGLGTTSIQSTKSTNQSSERLENLRTQINSSTRQDGKDGRSGFEVLSHLTDISNWSNLLTGGDATLFSYDLPLLKFSTEELDILLATIPLPPLPITVDVRAIGKLSAVADLGFGYDTYGIRQYLNTGYEGYIFDGFYLKDWDQNGRDKPEFEFTSTLGIKAGLSAGVAEVGLKGTLTLDVDVDL